MSEGRKKLALVDDHPIVIEGLKSVLSKWNRQYDLICFSNGLSILNYLHDHHIDIVLLDISLPDINGLEVRSEEHTSELQSRENLVCRLLLGTKKRCNYGQTGLLLLSVGMGHMPHTRPGAVVAAVAGFWLCLYSSDRSTVDAYRWNHEDLRGF